MSREDVEIQLKLDEIIAERPARPLHLTWTNLLWFRDGRISHGAGYTNRRAALEAVGIGEQVSG